MEDEYITKLHEILLIITDEIDKICRSNRITYSLYGGTLLGAVRHQGFIPWDDDLDIAMLREDYTRFIKVCQNELGSNFNLITYENTPEYGYNFAKVTLKGTRVKEGNYLKEKQSEIWVDVFPLDNVPQNSFEKYIQKTKNYFYIKLLEERFDGLTKNEKNYKKILAYKMLNLINRVVSAQYIKKKNQSNCLKYDNSRTMYISSMSSSYGYDKETIPREIFDSITEYKFEDRRYLGVKNYDYWLKRVFGNYMELPPIEKRQTHGLTDVFFSDYL